MAIKHKLVYITMLTCVSALILAGGAFIAWEWNSLHRKIVRDVSTHAEMIADNCKAALAFEDADDAKEILQALHVDTSLVFGCVYTKDGQIFATYESADSDKSTRPAMLKDIGHTFADGLLIVFKPVVLDAETIGTVCLQSDLKPMYASLKYNASITVAILLFVCLIAYFVSSRLQRIISGPILGLAEVAKAVSEKREYSTRAVKKTNDEVGLLIDAFNEMLEQIQQRDMKLVGAKKQLEVRVDERTSELSSTNVKLAEEIAERSSTQRKLQEHVKRTDCLYGLSKLLERSDISLEETFQETTHLIRNTYKEPAATCVRITFRGIHYKTDNFKKTEVSQQCDINVRGDKTGAVEVYYIGQKQEALFSREEHDLLDAIAEHLGRIAERKQAREKLELFRNLIDRSNDNIFVIEPQWGRFLDVNEKACDSLGYTREELLDMTTKDIDELIENDSAWKEHVREVREKGYMVFEGMHKRKNGFTFPVETNVRLIQQDEKSYLLAVSRDITERKRAEERQAHLLEQVEKINEELKSFAYIISHDLKAPLRGINTLVNWITTDYGDKLGDEGKEQMDLLLGRVDRMQNLIEGVLEYSRVGRVKEKHVPVNLNELVPDVVDLLAPPENIETTVEGELPTIVVEETRIMQLFQNLLSNAIKYMDKPQGQIKIGCVEENSFWKFSVCDNGPGIEERYHEKIFQIFQTLTPRDEFESTGVGLTVVKKIVEMYGGRIWVESEVGHGTTFFFTLPKEETGTKNEKLEANIAQ
jgi:PAS domain S-box-containing protein